MTAIEELDRLIAERAAELKGLELAREIVARTPRVDPMVEALCAAITPNPPDGVLVATGSCAGYRVDRGG